MPNYSLYLAMHNGSPCLIVEIPSLSRYKFVVRQAESFSDLRAEYMHYKKNAEELRQNVETYVLPAAQAYANGQRQYA